MTVARLSVEGNRLVADGRPVLLRGASIADPFYLGWEGRFGEELLDVLAGWGANVVRVPVHPLFWRRCPDYAERYLDVLLEWAEGKDMYVIIDWHAIGNPLTGETPFPSWASREPWRGQPYEPDINLARAFWRAISERYSGRTNVLYELFNEPTWIGWRTWRRVAEILLKAVRENDRDVVVLVGGTDWCSDLRWARRAPLEGPDVAYAVHVYPRHRPSSWPGRWGFLCSRSPVLITEWGFKEDASIWSWHLRGAVESFGRPLMDYARGRVAGWVAWIFHPRWEPNMLSNWRYELTPFGSFVKAVMEEAAGCRGEGL